MSKILENVLENLKTDERYNAILSKADDKTRVAIEDAVQAFSTDIAAAFDQILGQLQNDAKAREEFIARFKR